MKMMTVYLLKINNSCNIVKNIYILMIKIIWAKFVSAKVVAFLQFSVDNNYSKTTGTQLIFFDIC